MVNYENLPKEKLLKVLYALSHHSTKQRAFLILKGQIEGMLDYLEANPLVSDDSMKDKDDKTWDRGKWIIDNLTNLTEKLQKLEDSMTGLESKYHEAAKEGSLESDIKEWTERG